jgi:hypothetical protein
LHSIEKLITVLERASLVHCTEFSFRVISDRWRDTPLSAIGAFQRGGRYNAPETFPVLYTADSQMTALVEAEALFMTADGQLRGANLGRLPFDSTFGPLKLESLWAPCALRGIEGEQTLGAVTVNGSLHLTHTSPVPIPGLLSGVEEVLHRACAI